MKFCQARLSPPLVGQIVAEASIDAPREYHTEVYDEYIARRKCLIDGLNRLPGVYSPIPMGAFYTVARLPIDDSDRFCEWCLRDFSWEGQTIFMAPASGFYTTPGMGRDEVAGPRAQQARPRKSHGSAPPCPRGLQCPSRTSETRAKRGPKPRQPRSEQS